MRRKKKAKRRAKKKKAKKKPAPPPAPEEEDDCWAEESSVSDTIKRNISERLSGISSDKLKGLEEKPLPDTMSSSDIDEELNELLGGT